MNIDEQHKWVLRLLDQEQAGYFSDADIDSFLDRGSMWLFNKYRREYASSVDAYEALAVFKATPLDYATNGSGVYAVAGNLNYVQLLSADVSVVDAVTSLPRRWSVEMIKEDELASRRNSQLLPPSATAPIAVETAPGAFKFYPEQVHAGTLRFFRRPAVPLAFYTQVGRTFTYVSGSSTQLEWTEPYQSKVIGLALYYMAVNLDNQLLQKIAQEMVGMDV